MAKQTRPVKYVPKFTPQVPIGGGIMEIARTVKGGGLLAKKLPKKK